MGKRRGGGVGARIFCLILVSFIGGKKGTEKKKAGKEEKREGKKIDLIHDAGSSLTRAPFSTEGIGGEKEKRKEAS